MNCTYIHYMPFESVLYSHAKQSSVIPRLKCFLEISPRNRYLSNRRRGRLDLKRDHLVAPAGGGGGIDGIYYVPGFVTKEEGRLLENAARHGGDGDGGTEWKDLYKRRLQIHGGTPHPSGMVEDELPPFLRQGVK